MTSIGAAFPEISDEVVRLLPFGHLIENSFATWSYSKITVLVLKGQFAHPLCALILAPQIARLVAIDPSFNQLLLWGQKGMMVGGGWGLGAS
jgi:hypothetical protein